LPVKPSRARVSSSASAAHSAIAVNDTMEPARLEMMATRLPHGQYLYCPEGGHLAVFNDQ
jgi:hypothetical protein